MSIDVLGPFEDAPPSHRFMMVVTDLFSRWVEAKPTPRIRNRDQRSFVDEVFHRFGFPAVVVTDGAPAYKTTLWTTCLGQHGIETVTAAIYHSRANSVERRVQELKKTLRALVMENPKNWPGHLQQALFALRTRANAATGATPSAVLFGADIRR